MKLAKRVITWLCIFCLLVTVSGVGVFAEEPSTVYADNLDTAEETASSEGSYFSYYEENSTKTRPTETITLDSAAQTGTAVTDEADGKSGLALYENGNSAEWSFTVVKSGVYSLYPTYYPLKATGKDIQVSVEIDGKTPFLEAAEMSLPRIWVDDEETEDGSYAKDSNGNELRPEQVEKPRWNTKAFSDVLGMYSEPYLFYLEEGTHTLKVNCTREALLLNELVFKNPENPVTYKEYLSKYEDKKAKGDAIRQEAEKAYEKTTSTLYPSYDRSNSATLPNDAYAIRLNTIGGSGWASSGAAISWEIDVKQAGLYELSFRVRQNFSDGLNAYRKLYINGEIPFAEAQMITFPYNQGWYLKTLGDENPYLVYLEPGDVITLECTSGTLDFALREVQQAVLDLNAVYREIIMITGTSPSLYQDYALDKQIPNLAENITAVCKELKVVAESMEKELGKSAAAIATIQKSILIFEELAEDTYFIPDRLSSFKGSIESLASLLLSLGGQGIELDCIYFVPEEAEQPSIKVGFFKSLYFNIKRFLVTFTSDYNSVGGSGDKEPILVWAAIGRDQAQIVNRLIEEEFTRDTGIPVTLNLVTGDPVLMKATLAGKGPDIALTVAQTTPVNLAARGALVDLNQFDLSELKSQIYESAWKSYEYQGGTYGIPDTLSAEVIFYRTDIFKSLGIEVPNTWDDFYHVLEVIQSNNLEVGLPEINAADLGNSLAITLFNKFLYQNGGRYYNDELTKTEFDTEAAYVAFEKTVELYRVYGVSRDLSFYNRFRSGEAPFGIAAYSLYAQLASAAPEIRGLWAMAPLPGTPRQDGTIDRSQTTTTTGCVMMKAAEKRGVHESAFKFMSWWSSADVQTQYGKEMEGVLGIIGRITPANRKAISNLGWSKGELSIINAALEETVNPPQVLGNYTVSRSLTSALRGAINDKNSPRRSLALYNKDINDEITRKRKEFKLD